LFAADAALFAIFVLRSTWLHAGEMLHAPLSRAADPTDEEADRA
jgi:hypothetical protein